MATRLYSVQVGGGNAVPIITEAVGSATVTNAVELTVDNGNVMQGSTVPLSKEDVLLALERLRNHIVKGDWPPV